MDRQYGRRNRACPASPASVTVAPKRSLTADCNERSCHPARRLFFYSRHFLTIVRLCLPLILLESLTRLGIDHWLGDNAPPALDLLVGLIFYPLYVGALILFLDARSRGHDPALGAVYARRCHCGQHWQCFRGWARC